ncbi:uncharacterized protein [Antedon mediterranea]|uniref:uncharacterized protein n=1 Tax=Antedon mediterranea TaxID=105859 RepID=UPI003AF7651A
MSSTVAQGNLQPRRTCSKKGQVVVGTLLSVSAGLTIIFGIVAVSLPTVYYAYGGNPLWSGAIILCAGMLCVLAGRRTANKCPAVGGLVMSIISILFSIDQILWMSVAAAREEGYNEHCTYYHHYYNNYYGSYYPDYTTYDCNVEIAIDAVLIVLGILEFAFSIAAVCVLSPDLCCPPRSNQHVMYSSGQPVVVHTGGYVQPMGPVYPPQTQIVNTPMYYQQPVAPYPGGQYSAGQPQFQAAGQPAQYTPAGQPTQYPATGQPDQYPATGQPDQYPGQVAQPAHGNPPAYNELNTK